MSSQPSPSAAIDTDFVPFALPDISESDIKGVVDALRSGWVSSGPMVKHFESEFAAFLGGGVHCVAVNSATAGLHLALEALGVGPGDEVIVPAWTFTATAEVVRFVGATPVFVDVEPLTLNMDPGCLLRAITPLTKAVMPVHFAGLAADLHSIRTICIAHGLAVVEDAAHALPSLSDGELVGAGDSAATVFSFYATKNMTTGEGGMLVTRNTAIADRARLMRLHGISQDAFARYRSSQPAWQYDVVAAGFKYNMTDPAAALGLGQLSRLRRMTERRRAISTRYQEQLCEFRLQLPVDPGGAAHSWHLFVVRLGAEGNPSRDEFIANMAARGVACSVHFIPLHLQPFWRETSGLRPEDLPVASAEFRRVVSLPLYSRMSDSDVDRVIDAVTRTLTP